METAGLWERNPVISPPHTRVAIPDGEGFKIHEISSTDFRSFSDKVVDVVVSALEVSHPQPPETAVRELIDNLVHAVPCAASVVVDPSLNRFYVSDTGPGISRLDLALEPGYSTATEAQRSVIRGVGLGFYLAEKEIADLGGNLQVFSQPGGGTYISVSLTGDVETGMDGLVEKLSHRQNNILFLLTEEDSVGPSQVASELGISLSTAHRELVKLERLGLITRSTDGKRFLSDIGKSYLQSILSL
ncbi:ATP-binding protein [Candidatus Solincola tengchongensis]|uniref:ATP-binding protein n=1 Tax=Candidatus Solincola tengchongensis TaxID=2900693 RepID=UPI00257E4B20